MSVSISETSIPSAGDKVEIQLVIFAIAGCELAIEINQVREIIRVSETTLMPKAPKFLEGIINLRGRIFPVLDLKKRFEMPLVEKTKETRILVVEFQNQVLGLLVDRVVEVLKLDPQSILPAKAPVLNVGVDFIKGLISLKDRLVIYFNLEKAFNFESLKILPEWNAASQKEEKNLGH